MTASTVSVGLAAAAPHHLRHAASGRVAASEHAMTQDCAKVCTLDETVNVPIQDWATQKQSDVSSALQAHPDINAVLVAFDGMTTFVDPAVEAAHKSSLNVYTWGGSASVEKLMLQKSSLIAADGTAVLFVSHDFSAIRPVARRAVVLRDGHVVADVETARTSDEASGRSSSVATGRSPGSPGSR
ncbi:MAG: hypothetical protein M0T71_00040 [Actinomycetota bacterium]|nr:hypothetical protein [Actinomycetota bacterium]